MSERAFEYIGPMPGGTPSGDADLHSSDNPFEAGSHIDRQDSSDFPTASPLGYWTNPVADPNNPYYNGVGPMHDREDELGRAIAGSINDTYDRTLRGATGADASGASGIDFDEGYGTSGEGRS